MAKGEPKPEATRNIPNFITFGDKTLSSLGYIAWIKNATLELKKAYSSIPEINSVNAEEVERMGSELIRKITIDDRNLEISSLDKQYGEVAEAKEPMLNMVELIKQKCGILKISDKNQESRAIEITPLERPLPDAEMRKPSTEEISMQAQSILDLNETYVNQYLPVLKEMLQRYKEAPLDEYEMMEQLRIELLTVRGKYLDYMEKDLEDIIGNSGIEAGKEYDGMREAINALEKTREEIRNCGPSDFESEQGIYPEAEIVG